MARVVPIMADNLESDLIRDIAILLIVRIIQIGTGILAMFGIIIGKYPESVLAILFCLAINSGIPRNNGKE